jgi:hypothetical protein
MLEPFQNAANDFRKMGEGNYDLMLRPYGELSKGFQAIGGRMTEYSKQLLRMQPALLNNLCA